MNEPCDLAMILLCLMRGMLKNCGMPSNVGPSGAKCGILGSPHRFLWTGIATNSNGIFIRWPVLDGKPPDITINMLLVIYKSTPSAILHNIYSFIPILLVLSCSHENIYWLVFSHRLAIIIPTDFHIFMRGVETTNHIIYIYMYVCMYTWIHTYIYIYTFIHTHTHTPIYTYIAIYYSYHYHYYYYHYYCYYCYCFSCYYILYISWCPSRPMYRCGNGSVIYFDGPSSQWRTALGWSGRETREAWEISMET